MSRQHLPVPPLPALPSSPSLPSPSPSSSPGVTLNQPLTDAAPILTQADNGGNGSESVRSRKRWGWRSTGKKKGDRNVDGVGESSGKSQGMLPSCFSRLAGSSWAAASPGSPSTANSSPSTYSRSGAHKRKSIAANVFKPGSRSANGSLEALASECALPMPPTAPHWSAIPPGTGIGKGVPPTPSSFSLTPGASPQESLASSMIGGASPNGLTPALRTSRSVSNLNLLANRSGSRGRRFVRVGRWFHLRLRLT
jgi:hypothetical protein